MAKMVKLCRDAMECEHHINWFSSIDKAVQPDGVTREGDETYSYEYVRGDHPSDPVRVWAFAYKYLWAPHSTSILTIARTLYADYVLERWVEQGYKRGDFTCLAYHIMSAPLTGVHRCHGDLTLENCIETGSGVVFLDPGYHRCLPCAELDEAKLLQSCDGWHYRKHAKHCQVFPFSSMPIHTALLITHYVRLLRHDHPSELLEWARGRIDFHYEELKKYGSSYYKNH